MKKSLNILGRKGFIDLSVLLIVSVMMLVLFLSVIPVFITKMNLDFYAEELARTAEISGRIGVETTAELAKLNGIKGTNPAVVWDKMGKFQLGTDAVVNVTKDVDIGFYIFKDGKIKVTASAVATSEVYWKVL